MVIDHQIGTHMHGSDQFGTAFLHLLGSLMHVNHDVVSTQGPTLAQRQSYTMDVVLQSLCMAHGHTGECSMQTH
jgi:hypothetical protein